MIIIITKTISNNSKNMKIKTMILRMIVIYRSRREITKFLLRTINNSNSNSNNYKTIIFNNNN